MALKFFAVSVLVFLICGLLSDRHDTPAPIAWTGISAFLGIIIGLIWIAFS